MGRTKSIKLDKTIEDFYEFQLHKKHDIYHPVWTVHFINGRGLSIDEVTHFFSKFGQIYGVGQSYTPENTKGLCFVNFRNEESAKKCISEMKDSDTIRLRPFLNPEYPKDHCHHKYWMKDSVCAKSKNLDTFYEALADKWKRFELNGELKEIVESHDVIVADIPEMVGVNFILELFKEYEPIAASNIEIITVIGEKSLRCCHVYFKDSIDAECVEWNYDDKEFFGKRLIVLRAERLAAFENGDS